MVDVTQADRDARLREALARIASGHDGKPAYNAYDAREIARKALQEAADMTEAGQEREHWSDCAIYNEPAEQAGPCNCGGRGPSEGIHKSAKGGRLFKTLEGMEEAARIAEQMYAGHSKQFKSVRAANYENAARRIAKAIREASQ